MKMKSFIGNSRNLFNEQNINVKEYIFNGSAWVLSN